ncbi:MAG: cell division protein FtsZ [Anaerolineaceae bacterium]|nr:cell division protein FtsZ [Anaerolineaceae bacterium]
MQERIVAKVVEKDNDRVDLPRLKVIGLGGGGSNAINRMIELGITGVDFIAANTDLQVLKTSRAPKRVQLGPSLTRGLGAGGNPRIGEAAAEESFAEIRHALKDADMVFLTAGMGGGTGTGAIGVAARIAKEMGAITVAIVTTPFTFEMKRRAKNAQWGLDKLKPHCDTLITVPNDKLLKTASVNLPLDIAFRLADDLLRQGIQGITELITKPGVINVSYMHLLNQFKTGGGSILAIGQAKGENKTVEAVRQALHHPLLDDISLNQATSVIANFTGGDNLSFLEVAEALTYLHDNTPLETEVIPGVVNSPMMEDRVEVILVITGIGGEPIPVRDVETVENKYIFESASLPTSNEFQSEKLIETRIPTKQRFGLPKTTFTNASINDLDIPAFLRRKIG